MLFILDQARSFGWIGGYCVQPVRCGLPAGAPSTSFPESTTKSAWKAIFVGVPAPAGALLVLVPVYLGFLGFPIDRTKGLAAAALHHVHPGFLPVAGFPCFREKVQRGGRSSRW